MNRVGNSRQSSKPLCLGAISLPKEKFRNLILEYKWTQLDFRNTGNVSNNRKRITHLNLSKAEGFDLSTKPPPSGITRPDHPRHTNNDVRRGVLPTLLPSARKMMGLRQNLNVNSLAVSSPVEPSRQKVGHSSVSSPV